MTAIKAILFDMDGVLIDAREWHFEALNRALRLFGFEISRYDHLVSYDGLPTKTKLKMLTLDQGLPESLHGFINEMKQQYTMEIIYSQCRPQFDHEYALSRLRADGLRLVVCSNSIRKTVDTMLERAALHEYLDFTLSNEDVKSAKPDPEIYVKAIKRLELDPKECLVVEDNQNGVKAAIASGSHVMQVDSVFEVNYTRIQQHIARVQKGARS
jgi:beta-phosphoglucomutase